MQDYEILIYPADDGREGSTLFSLTCMIAGFPFESLLCGNSSIRTMLACDAASCLPSWWTGDRADILRSRL